MTEYTEGSIDNRHGHDHHAPDHAGHQHGTGAWDDETAERYVENYGNHATNRLTVSLAHLQPDDWVIDVGCGSGEAVREAATRLEGGRVTGIDPTPAMLRIARELSESHDKRHCIRFLEGSAEDLPVPRAAATVVMAINSLHHWQDPAAGLAEIMRVLKPGGRLLIADEEPEEGHWGHGTGPMTDPAKVVRTVEHAQFIQAITSHHVESEVSMNLLVARKPTG